MGGGRHDPRDSAAHRALLETRATVRYLPHALRWAMRFEVLSIVLVFGAVIGVFAGFVAALWIVILFGSGAIAWLLAVQARAIWGFGDPPSLDAQQLVTIGLGALRLLLIGALVTGGFLVLHGTVPPAGRVFAWTVGAMLPSVFALMAVEDSLAPALNPVRILRVVVHGGPLGWLLAAATAAGLDSGLQSLAGLTIESSDLAGLIAHAPTAGKVGWTIMGLWVLAVVLHLHGHALHHRHEAARLGVVLQAADDDELESARRTRAVERAADRLEQAAARGDRPGARQIVSAPPPEGVSELPFLDGLWEQMLFRRRHDAAVLVARRLLPAAATQKRYALALSVWSEAKRLSPSFEPGPGVRLALTRMAAAAGDAANIGVFSDCDAARWPDDPAAVELAYLRAGWLAERRGQEEAARRTLEPVLGREHPLAARVKALYELLGG